MERVCSPLQDAGMWGVADGISQHKAVLRFVSHNYSNQQWVNQQLTCLTKQSVTEVFMYSFGTVLNALWQQTNKQANEQTKNQSGFKGIEFLWKFHTAFL